MLVLNQLGLGLQ